MSMIDFVGGVAGRASIGAMVVVCGAAMSIAAELPGATMCGPEIEAAARARPRMLERLAMLDEIQNTRGRSMCFAKESTPEQMAQILQEYNMLPPTLLTQNPRYRTSSPVWRESGLQGANGQATRANLTISFPNDGVSWDGGANNLNASLPVVFGSVERGREFIRQGYASWRRFNGLTYTEVADDNVAFTQSTANATTRGNCRIGSRSQGGVFGVLAYNYFPSDGSDMVMDSSEFVAGSSFGTTANNFRYFRNTISHEHGHGLSAIHTVPCNDTKLMEPQLSTSFDGIQLDDVRFAARNYGDKYAGNNSGALAKDFGNLTSPSLRSVIERNLSTNGTAGPDNSDEDWFKFTLGSAQNVVITVDPVGGSYTEGQQSSGCTGTTGTVNADAAGNLNIELRNGANGATVVQTASSAAAGVDEVLTANNLAAGTYWVRVVDVGPNASANQFVQLYNMTLRVGSAKAPPFAIAGIHKRIAAGVTSHFVGNVNSYAVDTTTGTTPASINSYAWDLDGDGAFGGAQDSSLSQTSKTYVSNGTYPITLRVTDSNNMSGTDTINLVVFGAQASIASISPTSGNPGNTVPVTINGVNFKGVTAANLITTSLPGISVTGTPVVNSMGTQITGLSFAVSAGAPNGIHDVSVTNSDGSGTASGNATLAAAFTVGGPCVAPSISGTLAPQDVCVGTQVVFTVNASGTNLNYEWRRNGAVFGAPSLPTLTLNNVQESTSANYYCIVSNPCGMQFTNFALLTVLAPPAITQQPQSQSICAGQNASFSVLMDGEPISYQWQKDGMDIPGAESATYTITGAVTGDQGSYACIINTGCQIISSAEVDLNVGAAPSISSQPASASACVGGSAMFSVAASNATGYQWRKNTTAILGATDPTYTIASVVAGDQGSYDCVITGACSNVFSDTAVLTVGSAPEITAQPTAQASCRGGSVTLSVTATGATGYQWRKNTVNVNGATSATLTINPVTVLDVGSYDCVVTGACSLATSNAVSVTSCPADYNCNGSVTIQDIFDYLNAWFASDPTADFNGGGVTIQDIFDYLNAWFAGCV